ncbi:MAG TPA: Ig-like domain-containing protein [Gemmataceae bacterium]
MFSNDQAPSGNGGGIYNTGNPTINQCTFTDCSAGLKGGAIRETTGTGTGKGNTVNGNKITGVPGVVAADETGGGISIDPAASFTLVNSIVAQNTAPTNPDVDGNFTDDGHNFIGDGTGGDFLNGVKGDQVGDSVNPLDPMLGPLQDNGGGIDTELPLAGSPVIDAGDNNYALSADARGYVRIINNVIDIGAVEFGSHAPNATSFMSLSSSAANNATLNQAITFTASLSGGSGTPTGSVTFLADGALLGTTTLDANGNAAITTSNLSLGSHTITAVYSGDDTYGSNSAFLNQTISQGGTFTSLSASPNPAQPGQAVTFTASVFPEGSSGMPSGSVTFLDGTTVLGTGTLSQVGSQMQATFITSTLSSGSHAITAVYGGDSTFMASSASITETIGQASGAGSSVSLSASTTPALLNQSVTLTATVMGMGGTPTGSVTFFDGTTVLGTASLSVVNGQAKATLTTSTLGLGSNDIVAVYSGDGTFAGSATSMMLPVNQGGTSTSLTSSANPSPAGQNVTFTATVLAMGMGVPAPTGTVSFYDGTTFLGTGELTLVNGQMQATFTTAALGLGSHRIIAVYTGDSTFADSGAALQQTIN